MTSPPRPDPYCQVCASWPRQMGSAEDHAFTLAELGVAPVLVPRGPGAASVRPCLLPCQLACGQPQGPGHRSHGPHRAGDLGLPCLRFRLLLALRAPSNQLQPSPTSGRLCLSTFPRALPTAPLLRLLRSLTRLTWFRALRPLLLISRASWPSLLWTFGPFWRPPISRRRCNLSMPSACYKALFTVHNLGRVVQFTVKLPLTRRLAFLRLSGTGPFFVRDFLAQGADPQDHSVVHRFWPLNPEGLRAALAVSRALEGFAGLAPLKRGPISSVRRSSASSGGLLSLISA